MCCRCQDGFPTCLECLCPNNAFHSNIKKGKGSEVFHLVWLASWISTDSSWSAQGITKIAFAISLCTSAFKLSFAILDVSGIKRMIIWAFLTILSPHTEKRGSYSVGTLALGKLIFSQWLLTKKEGTEGVLGLCLFYFAVF